MNEHLMISIEESESSTEEIETLNEELQATNEELETLNEELQATIEELNTTNDELHVRGVELQAALEQRDRAIERAASRDSDFVRLFSEIPVAAVHYKDDGSLDKMSDGFLALLEAHGDPLPLLSANAGSKADPLGRAARGEAFTESWLLDGDGRTTRLELRSRRLMTDGRGMVLVLIELPG